jgi:hypothetical protein
VRPKKKIAVIVAASPPITFWRRKGVLNWVLALSHEPLLCVDAREALFDRFIIVAWVTN